MYSLSQLSTPLNQLWRRGSKAPLDPTCTSNEHPQDSYGIRSSLYAHLRERNICSCCGNSDPLFLAHGWKECPYMPHNKKIIPSADKPPVSPLAMSSEKKQMSSFPVLFNGSYLGRTSPVNPGISMHTMYSFSSRINPAGPSSAPVIK